MTNWVDLSALRVIIFNVIVQKQPDFGGNYRGYRMTNRMFLEVIRGRYSPKTLKMLSLDLLSNSELLTEFKMLAAYFQRENSDRRNSSLFKGGYFLQGESLSGQTGEMFNPSAKKRDTDIFKSGGNKIRFQGNNDIIKGFSAVKGKSYQRIKPVTSFNVGGMFLLLIIIMY